MSVQQETQSQIQSRADQVAQAQRTLNEVNTSVATLQTEADKARGIFGFGRRILVPPDEIHVVVGDGRHIWTMSSQRKVFGQIVDRPSRYWLNAHTRVIKLKTVSFTVALHGFGSNGVQALDSSKVSFQLWAHAVAKLNPEKAEVAAQRVGLETTGLIRTITEVGMAELVAAGATMTIEEIISDRQKLSEIAFSKVNQILSELGYDLALLTITRLGGNAYEKLIEQAESRISKETGVATNKEQLAELRDDQLREQEEAEVRATTEKKLASERLDAQREVETATISQQESLDISRHEMQLKQVDRSKTAAENSHDADLAKVKLVRQLGEEEAEKDASLAQIKLEREAELRAIQQQRQASIRLAETEAEAARMAVEQEKQIERKSALTIAEADRLRKEELERAERSKNIALVETSQMTESMKMEAGAEANALQIKVDAETHALRVRVDAETQMELIKAEAEATATEKRAQAAKVRAEATKAETAASGLAEAEVESARVEVSEKRVAVTRAEGLAHAEVSRAQATAEAERRQQLKKVEIDAQTTLAKLYEEAPVLVDLEKLRMQLEHERSLATIQADASLKAFEAIAPGVKVHVFGNGGQTGQIMANLMSITHGLTAVGEESPLIGRMLGQDNPDISAFLPKLGKFVPALKELMGSMNTRMFATLKVADVVERLAPIVAGDEDLATGLAQIKQDANFRMVGDLPISPLLRLLGIGTGDAQPIEDVPIVDGDFA